MSSRLPNRLTAASGQTGGSLRSWAHEAGSISLCAGMDGAAVEVIIDQSHCLHESVGGGRPDEPPALSLELVGQGLGFRTGRAPRQLVVIIAAVAGRWLKAPHESGH